MDSVILLICTLTCAYSLGVMTPLFIEVCVNEVKQRKEKHAKKSKED